MKRLLIAILVLSHIICWNTGAESSMYEEVLWSNSGNFSVPLYADPRGESVTGTLLNGCPIERTGRTQSSYTEIILDDRVAWVEETCIVPRTSDMPSHCYLRRATRDEVLIKDGTIVSIYGWFGTELYVSHDGATYWIDHTLVDIFTHNKEFIPDFLLSCNDLYIVACESIAKTYGISLDAVLTMQWNYAYMEMIFEYNHFIFFVFPDQENSYEVCIDAYSGDVISISFGPDGNG